MRHPVVIQGASISRWRASWLLLTESWRFLRADAELVLIPVVSIVLLASLLTIEVVLLLVSGLLVVDSVDVVVTTRSAAVMFLFYGTTVLVGVLASAAVTHTVAVRATGGNATLAESFKVACSRLWPLLGWSLLASTVGIVLKSVSERSAFVGRILAALFGAAWGVLTIFVIPAIVLQKHAPVSAIKHSAQVFTRHWGETVVTNVSLGIVFLVLHISAIGLFLLSLFVASSVGQPLIFALGAVLWLLWILVAIVLQQVLATIITTLLYIYATAAVPPANFNQELLAQIMQRTRSSNTSDASSVIQ